MLASGVSVHNNTTSSEYSYLVSDNFNCPNATNTVCVGEQVTRKNYCKTTGINVVVANEPVLISTPILLFSSSSNHFVSDRDEENSFESFCLIPSNSYKLQVFECRVKFKS